MLRVARHEDIPGMHRVRLAVTENRLTSAVIGEADYGPYLDHHGRGWVVEEQGSILGFAIADARDGSIWALFVDPSAEGRGHGRRLHDTMLAWLGAQGLTRLWLTTEADTRAARFYAAAGWQDMGRTRSGEIRFERPVPA